MTNQQFRKFKIDWCVFKQLTMPPLYSFCEDSVQNSIVNTNADFFTLSQQNMIQTIETFVTERSNPAVHHLNFATLSQSEGESTQNFIVRLEPVAQDCEYSCPSCQAGLQSIMQRINLHEDYTTKPNRHSRQGRISRCLEDIIKHAEAFELVLRDQAHLH